MTKKEMLIAEIINMNDDDQMDRLHTFLLGMQTQEKLHENRTKKDQ